MSATSTIHTGPPTAKTLMTELGAAQLVNELRETCDAAHEAHRAHFGHPG